MKETQLSPSPSSSSQIDTNYENYSSLSLIDNEGSYLNSENTENHVYLNSNMISCDEVEANYEEISYEDYFHQMSEVQGQYSLEEESKQLSIRSQDRSYELFSQDYSDGVQRKRLPLKVVRKTGLIELNKTIDMNINFMLLGDIFINKDVFIDCRDQRMSNICPVSAYRPVISTEKTDKYCIAFVESSSSGMSDIRYPVQLLQSLNFNKAHQISEQLIQLLQLYENSSRLLQNVYAFYRNDQLLVQSLIRQNHLKSLQIAHQHLKNITQEKIIMFHYKKIDPLTLTHKLHYTGSNMTMSELFTGRSDFSIMEQYMNRIGTPRYIDAEGMINLTLAKFSGLNQFDLNLITLDDLIIPLNCTIKRIFLHEFEIIPGEKMSEYLDIHILDANLNVIQDVLAKRKSPSQLSAVSQLEYEMKAEIFIQKFYDGDIENATSIYA